MVKNRVAYSVDTKNKALEMKLQGYSTKQVMQELNIKNETQVKTWSRWYKNGEILAYTIGSKQDTKFVLDTLNQIDLPKDVLLHSDQGSVYTSVEYYNLCKEKGIIRSMSRPQIMCPSKASILR